MADEDDIPDDINPGPIPPKPPECSGCYPSPVSEKLIVVAGCPIHD